MRILVLLKQVPDMENVKFDREKGRIDRTSAGTEINPFDLNALEAAVRIKEKINSTVIALTMGPPNAEEVLKEAISRGADDGILLSDRKFGGADVKATSKTLAAAIKKVDKIDLIFAGIQTVDGDTGQVGPEIAEYLNIPHVSNVEDIKDFTEDHIDVVSNIFEGIYIKRAKYPALITVTKDVNVPRLPSFKNKMAARKAIITKWGYEDIKDIISEDEIGSKGSATKVKKIEVPPIPSRIGRVFRDSNEKAVTEIIKVCEKMKVLEV